MLYVSQEPLDQTWSYLYLFYCIFKADFKYAHTILNCIILYNKEKKCDPPK